jgi:hypothetical protein
MAESKNFRIVLEPALKGRVVDIFDAQGISQQEGIRRLLLWFCDQPDVIRAAVLGQLPASISADVARIVLERMAGVGSAASVTSPAEAAASPAAGDDAELEEEAVRELAASDRALATKQRRRPPRKKAG